MIDLATEAAEVETYVSEQLISTSVAGNVLLRRTSFLRTAPDRYIVVFKLADLEIEGRGNTKAEAFKKMLAKLHNSTRES